MIVVDTSALMAILQSESRGEACIAALRADGERLISAGTIAEALVVGARRGILDEMLDLVERLSLRVIDVTPQSARRVGRIYAKWGKGLHPAGLNFGDCFAYEVAQQHGCSLLYVGDDFSRTDMESALPAN